MTIHKVGERAARSRERPTTSRIARVSATIHRAAVELPLVPEAVADGAVVVRVEADDGVVGWGLTGGPLSAVRAYVNRNVARALVGEDALLTEHLWDRLYGLGQGSEFGVWSAAVSATDIALWDLKGRILGQPVWRLLGGYRATIPAYATFGLKRYDRDELVEAARRCLADGYDKLKLVVGVNGAQDLAEDAERVRLVREAVGERVELMVDGNRWFGYPQALELAARLEPYRLTWFEEPVVGNDVRHLAALRRQTKVPIAAGEQEGHKWRFRELIEAGAVDYPQPNVISVGGYTEARKIAALAEAYRLPIPTGGGWSHYNAPFIASIRNGWRVEVHALHWRLGELLLRGAPRPEAGTLTLTDAPGLGFEPDPDALRDTLADE